MSTGADTEARVSRRSRRAGVALVCVLLAISFFAVWSSQVTKNAASRAVVASQLSDDYADAANAIGAEESLERKYRLEPGPEVQARYDQAAAMFVAALGRVQQDGSARDRNFVKDVLRQHDVYLGAIDRLFRATDRTDTAEALRIDNDEVDPSFGSLETAVLAVTESRHRDSLDQLSSLQELEDLTGRLTPLVFLFGMMLMVVLVLVTRGHRRLLGVERDHHQGVLASIGEGVIGVDARGDITFANPAAVSMLAASKDGLIGTGACAITCGGIHEPRPECALSFLQEAGTVVTGHSQEFFRADGTTFPAEVTAAPRRGPGNRSGMVLVFRDITERVAMMRMKSEFFMTVSHELRTPLTSIRLALEVLDEEETGAGSAFAAQMVATALRGSVRLSRLISDIIDFDRLERGSFPMRLAEVDVGPIVSEVVSDLQGLAARSGLELVVVRAGGRARCDADRLVQALVNLVGNAIKFSEPGGIVEVVAEPCGEFVQFTVTDSGCGIAATHVEWIFERFNQVEGPDARSRVGSGLGLSITKAIVEQQGGRIWAESQPGTGSTFVFTVPQSEDAGHQPPGPDELTYAPTEAFVAGPQRAVT